jgi:hypothetical protein
MAHRILALTLVSGHNLKDVNLFSRMEVYGIASIYGDPRTRQRTKTDRAGARHPAWDPDDKLWFAVPPTAATAAASASGGAYIHVRLRTERLFSFSDGDVGEVFIPLAELLAGASDSAAATPSQSASYQVRKVGSTERRGMLTVSYSFGPVMAPVLPVPDSEHWGNSYQLPKVVYPPSFPRMLPGAGLGKTSSFPLGLPAGGFGGMRFGDMEKSANVDAGHGVVAADATGVAV